MRVATMGTDRKPLAHPHHQRSDIVLDQEILPMGATGMAVECASGDETTR
jgi:hypothetical protein